MTLNPKQPRSDYFQSNVQPQTKTTLTLPGGQSGEGPFYYSLGTQSTCPFISLEGGGTSQKIFTWGELIQVDEEQMVTVKNESYHLGDIEIVSGHEYFNLPSRITVPVPVVIVAGPGGTIVPVFPADTRRCRKAYLYSNILTVGLAGGGLIANFAGTADKHSFASLQDPGVARGYNQAIVVPPGTAAGQLPMGYGGGLIPNSPMALTDKTTFLIQFGANPPTTSPIVFLYSLEY